MPMHIQFSIYIKKDSLDAQKISHVQVGFEEEPHLNSA